LNLNQITLPSIDLEKSIRFYQALGFTLIVQALPEYARFLCEEDGSTFSIHKVEALPQGEGVWIYFEEKKLDEKVKELQSLGIAFEELPTDKPWLWREARLKDPDNNHLILYWAGDNRINPPWKII
jgi:catechol 2,3-dioxygenase-like lactoylglutathione lyase family enzyme